ncbi:polysulfide reductase NrfD [Planctomycetaceae bacterium AH-315-I19]|nr:polysulfide reductase NrfD [Planctomycetaceae bacterium AH-315-I19]
MTTLEPDQAAALGLNKPARQYDPETIDGTIVEDPAVRPPLVLGDRDFHSVTETICGWVENKTPKWWPLAFIISANIAGLGTAMILYLIITGVGVWGLNNPVAWGWAIVNFVWWVGIGHAGTLISAILCIFKQKWRTSINRFAEAMTIFAVICAGTFPGIHIGRVWMAWMLLPLPNSNAIWPNFRSPLLWDVFAVGTYFIVSTLFWYMGMIPDIATLRDRAILRRNKSVTFGPMWAPHPLPKFIATKTITIPANMIASYVYGFLSLGWRFSARHWHEYEKAYLLFAGVATPLVLSVHSVVSFDFAVSIVPGWHTTIFPPYFVAGAVFSGFAMVLTLLIPARELYPGMKDFVTAKTMENMCKIITVTGTMVGFAYIMEFFIAWYGANSYEQDAFIRRAFGPYWWAYAAMFFCNVISPQVFWFKWARTTVWFIFLMSIVVNIGMWFERLVIVTTLSSDFLPSSWAYYNPTLVDIGTFIGTLGIFMTLFLLFCRFLPMLAISEVKNVMPQAHAHLHPPAPPHADHDHHDDENNNEKKEGAHNG